MSLLEPVETRQKKIIILNYKSALKSLREINNQKDMNLKGLMLKFNEKLSNIPKKGWNFVLFILKYRILEAY